MKQVLKRSLSAPVYPMRKGGKVTKAVIAVPVIALQKEDSEIFKKI